MNAAPKLESPKRGYIRWKNKTGAKFGGEGGTLRGAKQENGEAEGKSSLSTIRKSGVTLIT